MMWLQNRARVVRGDGPPEIFLLKWCNLAHSECSKIRHYQPKNQQF